MTLEGVVLLSHGASTLLMTGLIWFVQVVHYPLFRAVGAEAFCAYEAAHQRRTTLVVGPLMLIEAVTATWLVVSPPDGAPRALLTLGLGLVAMLWLSTAFVQAPMHGRLSRALDTDLVRRLVRTNWLRTAGWTARSVIALALLPPSDIGA